MGRTHVREAVALAPDTLGRAFTLKEIVRRGEERGGRVPGEALDAWLARLHEGRRPVDLLGDSDADDVADPIGGPRRSYERTAGELERALRELPAEASPRPRRSPKRFTISIFGGVERKGRWRVPRRSFVLALLGGADVWRVSPGAKALSPGGTMAP